jgi:maltooligosyltrehalose trehalohydrolase
VDTASWQWNEFGWTGRPWEEAVIYELHTGAFTPEGTFRAAAGKLDYLASLGITAIELMPVAEFPGRWNWGYDGVLPYAPDSSYGRPEDLKALVEAAHQRGIMVFLDVVYNHFGPDGNYLPLYAPQFFNPRRTTPWGPAINFDGPGSRTVRDFFIQNAIYWLSEYHFDGLRLDAVHAIRDSSEPHFLEEISERVRGAAGARQVHLILENEDNQASRLRRAASYRPALFTAQWNDDVHHALHTALTSEDEGYYGAYRGDTAKLGRALAEGFAFQGEWTEYRGSERGEPCSYLPPTAFIAFLQNHDQVGNRAFGDRITQTAPPEAVRAAAAVYLLLPQIPMIFMGEEWRASAPFPFFSDFGAELADAVREGRREEFSRFREFRDPERRHLIPDPQSEETFRSGKLAWDELRDPSHRGWLAWYRKIVATRRERILPLLSRLHRGGSFQIVGEGAVLVRWALGDAETLVLAANLSGEAVSGFPPRQGAVIWQEGAVQDAGATLLPWTALWYVRGRGERVAR